MGSMSWGRGKWKVLHRDPDLMQEKLGFPATLGAVLDLWIHKAVLEHFSSYLPLGSFLTSKLNFALLNFQSGFQQAPFLLSEP